MQSSSLPIEDLHKARAALPLGGTHAKQQAALDFQSVLSIQYAQAWLNRQEAGVSYPNVHPKVPLAGIVRRALAVYMDHLADPDTDLNAEAFSVRLACMTNGTPPEDQPERLERLRKAMHGPAPMPFAEVFHGPEMAATFERLRAEMPDQ